MTFELLTKAKDDAKLFIRGVIQEHVNELSAQRVAYKNLCDSIIEKKRRERAEQRKIERRREMEEKKRQEQQRQATEKEALRTSEREPTVQNVDSAPAREPYRPDGDFKRVYRAAGGDRTGPDGGMRGGPRENTPRERETTDFTILRQRQNNNQTSADSGRIDRGDFDREFMRKVIYFNKNCLLKIF